MSNFEDVKKFMITFGQRVISRPQFPDEKTMNLRFDLIKEELNELEQAMKQKDLKEVADALTDILYVTYGAGCAYGIDLDKCFKEVQRANMSKLGEDGKPIYNEKEIIDKSLDNFFNIETIYFIFCSSFLRNNNFFTTINNEIAPRIVRIFCVINQFLF